MRSFLYAAACALLTAIALAATLPRRGPTRKTSISRALGALSSPFAPTSTIGASSTLQMEAAMSSHVSHHPLPLRPAFDMQPESVGEYEVVHRN